MTVTRYPNGFNFFSKPLCEAKLGPDLGVSAIKALTESSWSTCQIFQDEIKLRKNANIILNEVMNGTPESVQAELASMKKIYGNNIWKLLLAKTTCFENHCERHWRDVSAIMFAAWSGDFIHHQVPRVANTYLLNELFTYIPEEHRHLVIEQLQQVKTIGTEHGPALAAFHSLEASYTCYMDEFDPRDWAKNDACWQQRVGDAQKALPKFGLQLLCDPRAWWPTSDYKNTLAPKRDAKLGDGTPVFPAPPAWLGVSGAIYHVYRASKSERGAGGANGGMAGFMRRVFRQVREVKIAQLDAIILEQVKLQAEFLLREKAKMPVMRR
jgi:hypothetical protein